MCVAVVGLVARWTIWRRCHGWRCVWQHCRILSRCGCIGAVRKVGREGVDAIGTYHGPGSIAVFQALPIDLAWYCIT